MFLFLSGFERLILIPSNQTVLVGIHAYQAQLPSPLKNMIPMKVTNVQRYFDSQNNLLLTCSHIVSV